MATIQSGGGVLSFPNAGGSGGTFVYSANDAAGPVIATMTTSTEPVAVPFPPPGTALASYTLTLAQAVTFTAWHELLTTIMLPASISTAGHAFSEYGYDVTPVAVIGSGFNTGTVSGQTISFGDGLGPVSLRGDRTYLIVLTMR